MNVKILMVSEPKGCDTIVSHLLNAARSTVWRSFRCLSDYGSTKLESFSSGMSHKRMLPIPVKSGRKWEGGGRAGLFFVLFFLCCRPPAAAAASKQKTSELDKRLSGHPATLISKRRPKRPRRSSQYIKVEVKYCRVGKKAHNN